MSPQRTRTITHTHLQRHTHPHTHTHTHTHTHAHAHTHTHTHKNTIVGAVYSRWRDHWSDRLRREDTADGRQQTADLDRRQVKSTEQTARQQKGERWIVLTNGRQRRLLRSDKPQQTAYTSKPLSRLLRSDKPQQTVDCRQVLCCVVCKPTFVVSDNSGLLPQFLILQMTCE
jgi:hypothetical protein